MFLVSSLQVSSVEWDLSEMLSSRGGRQLRILLKHLKKSQQATYDLIIVGAGPAGISGGLTAKKHGLKFLILEQDTLGGTVATFPRQKIVMTSPMELPLYGKVKLFETSKSELLDLWQTVLKKNSITINENSKVESIGTENGVFKVTTLRGDAFTAATVLIAIGRRGTPRKLNIPGEVSEKVAYRLLEPEAISGKHIIVVGGGDSAVESALLLAGQNHVILSYRSEAFNRIKPQNSVLLNKAVEEGKLEVRMNTNLVSIGEKTISLSSVTDGQVSELQNDLVFIFAGGELPTQFLQNAGITITKKFGEIVMKH